MRDQLNARATSEITRTWKTIHTIHAPIHSNKVKGWLWQPNDIRGPNGPKASWYSSYRWRKTPKKPHPGNLSRAGIELGPAAWQAHVTTCSTGVDFLFVNGCAGQNRNMHVVHALILFFIWNSPLNLREIKFYFQCRATLTYHLKL